MSELSHPATRLYEIRLISSHGRSLLFATAKNADQEAVEHAKSLMLRHDCDAAEVWIGMKLIRRL